MKHSVFAAFLCLLLIYSCQKHSAPESKDDYLTNVKAALKDSLTLKDFNSLDFSKVILSKVDSLQLYLVRIPFNGKSNVNDFVLVKTKLNGIVERAKIIHLEGKTTEYGEGKIKSLRWDGTLSILSLDGKNEFHSTISNGYIKPFPHSRANANAKSSVQPDPYVELPEVVIVCTQHPSGGVSWSTWISLLSLLENNTYGTSTLYSYLEGGGGGGGGSTGGSTGGTTTNPPPPPPGTMIEVNVEMQDENPAIEIAKYLACFTAIPDAGSTCSIEIFTDIPVNGDPNQFFNWQTQSPGHTFIQLKKENGSQSATQNIGFYPANGLKTVPSPAPIDGKFVDNQHHEFNASYKIDLTPGQLNTAITRALYLARFVKYDIDDYNCTDWALSVFNETVSVNQQLEIPKVNIPGGESPFGSNTPQGLFIKLQELKQAGGSAAAGINIPVVGWVGLSNGPCN